jgi:NAD dependent epimerase/dehydratase
LSSILITGADGFIGSHLAETLVHQGHKVRALVLYNSLGSHGWLDRVPVTVQQAIEVVGGDIRDAAFVKHSVKGCDTVLHLAALIAIPYSYIAPASYVETNIVGTLNVLQAARELGAAKVIHTSTSEVYGTAITVPINEHHPLQGQSPYSATKIAADQLALSYYRSFGTPVAVVRPFNTYGPRQSARAVIPTIITQLSHGGRVKLGALHPTRDFNFVADIVAGFIAAAERPESVGETINLGTGFEISIGETARLIASLMGKDIELVDDSIRHRPAASEVERLLCDASKATQLLGWRPSHAGLEGLRRGLNETIAWFSDPGNLSMYRTGAYAI